VPLPHPIRAFFVNSRCVHDQYCAMKPSKTMSGEAYLLPDVRSGQTTRKVLL